MIQETCSHELSIHPAENSPLLSGSLRTPMNQLVDPPKRIKKKMIGHGF